VQPVQPEEASPEDTHYGFWCSLCKKEMANRWSLVRHVWRFHMHQGLVDTCQGCGLKCADASVLQRHLSGDGECRRLHVTVWDNSTGYRCDHCGRFFPLAKRAEIERHWLEMHSKRRACEKTCPTCGKLFFHLQLLQRHVCEPKAPKKRKVRRRKRKVRRRLVLSEEFRDRKSLWMSTLMDRVLERAKERVVGRKKTANPDLTSACSYADKLRTHWIIRHPHSYAALATIPQLR